MPHPPGPPPGFLPVQSWASWGAAPEGRGWHYVEEDGSEVELSTCPVLDRPDWWGRVALEWRQYEAGHLLEAGGISDQPSWWLEMMQAVSRWWGEFSAAAAKRRAGG